MAVLGDLKRQMIKEIDDSQDDDGVFEYECLHEAVRGKITTIGEAKGIEPDDVCKEESTRMTQKYAIDYITKLEEASRLVEQASVLGPPVNLSPITDMPSYSSGAYWQVVTSHFVECIDKLLTEIDNETIHLVLSQARELMLEIQALEKELDFNDNEYTRAVNALYSEIVA